MAHLPRRLPRAEPQLGIVQFSSVRCGYVHYAFVVIYYGLCLVHHDNIMMMMMMVLIAETISLQSHE
ncbi:hypothetical protein BLOT_002156 [Blomia tropicalis]|nr:hypothetical protein BLOT_002156 [Blomia tropicalis]